MTIQLATSKFARSKAVLQEALNDPSKTVWFHNPSLFSNGPSTYTQTDIPKGTKFPVVMDPETRRRFATVQRKQDGSFKVS